MNRSNLHWLIDEYQFGFCVTFARDVDPLELYRRMGGDSDQKEMLTRLQVELAILEDWRASPPAQVGRSGNWSFCLEHTSSLGIKESVLQAASIETQAVALCSTETIPWFKYAENGTVICSFDPGIPAGRHGAEPDRLLPAMTRVGLDPSTPEEILNPVERMLNLAVEAFGVGLEYISADALLPAGRLTARPPDA